MNSEILDEPVKFYGDGGHTVTEVRVHVVREATLLPAGVMNRPEACAEFFRNVVTQASWFAPDKECAVVLLLDRKSRLRGWNLVSLGSLTAALMHPREVFRPAIAAAASAVVVMHNHPSGVMPRNDLCRVIARFRRAATRECGIKRACRPAP